MKKNVIIVANVMGEIV